MLKILAYFLRNMQTLGVNNSSILTIKNAEFSGYYFQTNLNIWEDFQICISVPLTAYSMSETLFKCFWCTMNMSLFNAMFLMLRFLFRCLYCQYFEQISRLDLLFTCYQFCIESRRSHRGVVYKRCFLNYAIFTEKHLCWGLSLILLQAFRPLTILNRDSNTGISCQICKNF